MGKLWTITFVITFVVFLLVVYARHRIIQDLKAKREWDEERLLALHELAEMGQADPIDAMTRTVRAAYGNLPYSAKAVGRPQPWELQ